MLLVTNIISDGYLRVVAGIVLKSQYSLSVASKKENHCDSTSFAQLVFNGRRGFCKEVFSWDVLKSNVIRRLRF